MSEIKMYRIAIDGKGTGYGPYSTISSARNVASNMFGGWSWEGCYRKQINGKIHQIQKLTPVMKRQGDDWTFTMELEWVDYNGD